MRATIKVDADRVLGEVDRLIFGHFIEHLGRCIYGGVLDEHGRYRDEVIAAMRRIRPSILRWPGGCFADGYHWRDGVGPVEERPTRINPAWRNKDETNRFGTDEFVQYCQRLGAQPYICANVGSGTPEEAAAWVEYCNGTGATAYARMRRANGHEEPFGVRYWGVGNEIDETEHVNEIGCLSAEEYSRAVREYSKLMRRASAGITLVGVGSNRGEVDWNLTVLEKAGQYLDYIAQHGYYGTDDHYSTVAGPVHVEKRIRMLQSAIELAAFTTGLTRRIPIAFDEWNVWYRTRKDPQDLFEEVYELKDALFVAGTFNALQRMCGIVRMANLAQMVNALGMIHADEAGVVLSPLYHAFDLYANHTGTTVFDTFTVSETFDTHDNGGPRGLGPLSGVPYVDASATLREDSGRLLCLAVVNRHRDEPVECRIRLDGFSVKDSAAVFELTGAGPDARNTVREPEAVAVKPRPAARVGGDFVHTFAARSATVLEIPLTGGAPGPRSREKS
ncbi:MAG TPA: alpha-L-arabinofuranosidase C-terminal domain-containing protein [Spirochaetia bacterium]|nr:alpha-L-arabinofuranosidase C-terminal domain-containing protein [Spirochaetia bacterium]